MGNKKFAVFSGHKVNGGTVRNVFQTLPGSPDGGSGIGILSIRSKKINRFIIRQSPLEGAVRHGTSVEIFPVGKVILHLFPDALLSPVEACGIVLRFRAENIACNNIVSDSVGGGIFKCDTFTDDRPFIRRFDLKITDTVSPGDTLFDHTSGGGRCIKTDPAQFGSEGGALSDNAVLICSAYKINIGSRIVSK